mmetsp:Transcript_33652/g.92932  ORF Transcript_33652/g.92932 Transcript_33652/m.92932 type:complete len:229 (-) Transcript_33652:645-1331(-)
MYSFETSRLLNCAFKASVASDALPPSAATSTPDVIRSKRETEPTAPSLPLATRCALSFESKRSVVIPAVFVAAITPGASPSTSTSSSSGPRTASPALDAPSASSKSLPSAPAFAACLHPRSPPHAASSAASSFIAMRAGLTHQLPLQSRCACRVDCSWIHVNRPPALPEDTRKARSSFWTPRSAPTCTSGTELLFKTLRTRRPSSELTSCTSRSSFPPQRTLSRHGQA